MIHTLIKYSALILIVLKHGRWRHSGANFNENRKSSLLGLNDFVPPSYLVNHVSSTTSLYSSDSITRNFVAQFSFIKKSLKTIGGHLATTNLAYIRVPKSANTSISMEMLAKIYPGLKQKTLDERQINFLADVNLTEIISNNNMYFTIVRNPLHRLVSVYRSFFENDSPDYIYQDYLFGILPEHLSFSDFLSRIASIPDRLKDQHIRPQYCFLEYYENKKIDVKIFKLEETEKLTEFLNQNDLQLPHLNKSVEKYDYQLYFNTTSMNLACEIYQEDIKRFGYREEVETLKAYLKDVH